ncbi:hypothetical protein ACQPZJ_04960 [Actinoplanes sp. CA-054009]
MPYLRRGGVVDRLELMQMLLGHPEADVRVDLGPLLVDVEDVRYVAEREAVVFLLQPDDLREARAAGGRGCGMR